MEIPMTARQLPATTASHPRRFARAVGRAVEFTVKVSALVAAVFGILAWHEARMSGPDQIAAARGIEELRKIAALTLDREEERLVLDRAMLASLERLLPEAERTRLGIEQLAKLLDRRIEVVRAERRRLKTGERKRPTPDAMPWWSPDSRESKTAERVLREIGIISRQVQAQSASAVGDS
jgi:hypothetical protein